MTTETNFDTLFALLLLFSLLKIQFVDKVEQFYANRCHYLPISLSQTDGFKDSQPVCFSKLTCK